MKLLVKFPTRGRAEKFFAVYSLYSALAERQGMEVKFLVSCDNNDLAMNNPGTRYLLERQPDVFAVYGDSKNKIDAVNRDIDGVPWNWEWLILAADDMIPVVKGWDSVIFRDAWKHFPNNDGVLFYNDGHQGHKLNTLPIVGRAYYDRFGYIYHPDYQSLYADNEFMDVANNLGKQVYSDLVIIEHQHPDWTGAHRDELQHRNDAVLCVDQATYERRRAAGYPK